MSTVNLIAASRSEVYVLDVVDDLAALSMCLGRSDCDTLELA